MADIIQSVGGHVGTSEEECNEIIKSLGQSGFLNKEALNNVDQDNEWDEHRVPAAMRKAIR